MTSLSRPPSARPRITGPVELIQSVPYLLGFHPHDSLVLVGLQRGQLRVTARMDLADVLAPGLLADTIASFRRSGVATVVGVAYLDEGTPAEPDPLALVACDALAEVVTASGAAFAEMLIVTATQWWSERCAHTGCATVHGGPLPSSLSDYALAATLAGVAPLPDRAGLEAVLDPVPRSERVSVELLDRAEREAVSAVLGTGGAQRGASAIAAVTRAARASAGVRWVPPPDDECARLAVALTSISTRDEVWLRIDEGRLDGRPLWLELARRLPERYRPPVLLLYGWAMWRHGNGALARVAAEQAVDIDPEYTAADLLLAVLGNAMNPHTTPKLRARSQRPTRSSRGSGGGGAGPGGGARARQGGAAVRKRARTRGR